MSIVHFHNAGEPCNDQCVALRGDERLPVVVWHGKDCFITDFRVHHTAVDRGTGEQIVIHRYGLWKWNGFKYAVILETDNLAEARRIAEEK